MTGVVIRSDESFEKALKRFSRSCERNGIIADLKKNQQYEKPSQKRKRKKNAAIKKRIREMQEGFTPE